MCQFFSGHCVTYDCVNCQKLNSKSDCDVPKIYKCVAGRRKIGIEHISWVRYITIKWKHSIWEIAIKLLFSVTMRRSPRPYLGRICKTYERFIIHPTMMLLMGMWMSFTKNPMNPMMAKPIAVAVAIFWNSERRPYVNLVFRSFKGCWWNQPPYICKTISHLFYPVSCTFWPAWASP